MATNVDSKRVLPEEPEIDTISNMSIGKLQPFDPSTDNWTLYVDRLEQYFLVNKVNDSLKVPTLITVMGNAGYELLVTLCTPDKPSTKSFDVLVDLMSKHLQPKRNIMAERYKYRQRIQKEGESLSDYMADLKKLTKYCDFGNELESNLRDQFVCGIRDETIRQRLFIEDSLSYATALEMARAMEAAEKNAAVVDGRSRDRNFGESQVLHVAAQGDRNIRGSSRASGPGQAAVAHDRAVHSRAPAFSGRGAARPSPARAPAGARPRQQDQCRACGGPHAAVTCKFRVYSCRVCMQQGHLKKMCPRLRDSSGLFSLEVDEDEETRLEEI